MVTHPDSRPPCFSSRTISVLNPCNTCSAILSSEYLLSKQNDTSPGPIKRTYMCLPNFQHPTLPSSSTRHCNTPSAHYYQRPKHGEKLRHAGHTLFRGPQLLFAACHSRLYTQLSKAVCRTVVALAIPTMHFVLAPLPRGSRVRQLVKRSTTSSTNQWSAWGCDYPTGTVQPTWCNHMHA
jgi:hypothetical protein